MLTPTMTFPAKFPTRDGVATVLAYSDEHDRYVGLINNRGGGGFPCCWNAEGNFVLSDGSSYADDPDSLIPHRTPWDDLTDNQRQLARLIHASTVRDSKITGVRLLRTAFPDLGLTGASALMRGFYPLRFEYLVAWL